jgi:hypothetical protein
MLLKLSIFTKELASRFNNVLWNFFLTVLIAVNCFLYSMRIYFIDILLN